MTLGLLTKDSSRADHTVGQRRLESRWRGCWPVAECVGAILVLSVVLTYASPPDPLWIPGIYDDHDYDDVVGMVTDGTGLGDSRVPQVVESALVGFALGVSTPGRVQSPTRHRQTIRGPPGESGDAPVDLLLTSSARASRLSTIPLIHLGGSSGVGWSLCPGASALSPPGCDECAAELVVIPRCERPTLRRGIWPRSRVDSHHSLCRPDGSACTNVHGAVNPSSARYSSVSRMAPILSDRSIASDPFCTHTISGSSFDG